MPLKATSHEQVRNERTIVTEWRFAPALKLAITSMRTIMSWYR